MPKIKDFEHNVTEPILISCSKCGMPVKVFKGDCIIDAEYNSINWKPRNRHECVKHEIEKPVNEACLFKKVRWIGKEIHEDMILIDIEYAGRGKVVYRNGKLIKVFPEDLHQRLERIPGEDYGD